MRDWIWIVTAALEFVYGIWVGVITSQRKYERRAALRRKAEHATNTPAPKPTPTSYVPLSDGLLISGLSPIGHFEGNTINGQPTRDFCTLPDHGCGLPQ